MINILNIYIYMLMFILQDEEIKRNLRKDLTAQEEAVEEYERQKLNAERIRKKLEGEVVDLQVTSVHTILFLVFPSFSSFLYGYLIVDM